MGASRRALTVLRLFRNAPAWRLQMVWFTVTSRMSIGGIPWTIDNRSVSATDGGLTASIMVTTKALGTWGFNAAPKRLR